MRALFALLLVAAASAYAFDDTVPKQLVPEDMLKLRDPFKRPGVPTSRGALKSDLEMFPVEQFRMVGVVTGPNKLRAMLLGPNGKTYFVHENMKIGIRKGIIKKITTRAVHVKERVLNVLGQEESVEQDIEMTDSQTKTSGAGW